MQLNGGVHQCKTPTPEGGEFKNAFERFVSPFSCQMRENLNEINNGCETESLDKNRKNKLVGIFNSQWASKHFPVGSRQQRSSEQFSAQQKQQ